MYNISLYYTIIIKNTFLKITLRAALIVLFFTAPVAHANENNSKNNITEINCTSCDGDVLINETTPFELYEYLRRKLNLKNWFKSEKKEGGVSSCQVCHITETA